jgi:alkanesulfonate monooxygenase SsuD/methylene tetrahydromethanopterin reductase-like flavin-dependent oxidoreductase (luciferase family)
MPSPNVIAGALTQRTHKVKIAVIGNALPLYNHSRRVAKEFAMLGVMSNGRLIAGMVIAGAELKLIKDCGHLPMFEKEADFVETILRFCVA